MQETHGRPGGGWIEVIAGSMFSGKSEELIRRLRRAQIAKRKVQIFKPKIDNRYGEDHIISHSEMRIPSENLSSSRDLLERYLGGELPPQLFLGCYYQGLPQDRLRQKSGSCTAGSKQVAAGTMLVDAQRLYLNAIRVFHDQKLYSSEELRELETKVIHGSYSGGAYQLAGVRPEKGLAVARMAAHITYLSEPALQRKFGRELQRDGLSWGFDADFQVESYLRHQGSTFVDRFDANSYLYITRAMDYFDLAAEHGGVLANAFRDTPVRFCLVSFTSDWLFPTPESRAIVHALNAVAANVSFVEIESDKGHDAFLLEEPEFFATVRGFLNAAAAKRGLSAPPEPR